MDAILKQKYSFNALPRLSANQISEYLTATPTRRKSIVQAAKFPKTSVVARYDGARDGITEYLCDIGRDMGILLDAIDSQTTRGGKADATEWVKNDSALSIEAVESFQKSLNKLGFGKLECKPFSTSYAYLEVNGVKVSVSLDATVHRKDSIGGLLLLFSKSETSTKSREERCRTAAVLAYLYAQQQLKYLGTPDHKLCFAVDVFGGRSYRTPNMYKTKLGHIEISCEEIALRWPGTKPPDDYDGPAWT